MTTATISNLNEATTYYFAVIAYNSANLESQRSNEVSQKTLGELLYSLTVNSGVGDGSYPSGKQVVVTADAGPQGQQFARWDGDYVILANFLSPSTTATIPLRDVSIFATYSALPTYSVTVTNGTGDGNYLAGAQVPLVADPAPSSQQFAGWTGNVTFANASASSTTFVMPAATVSVTATYTASAAPTAGDGTGLRADYYNDSGSAPYPLVNPFAGTAVHTRTDTNVDFSWGRSSPGSPVKVDNFSVKWTGQVKAPASGSYTFTVTGDDGVRLFINGVKVIDGWKEQGPTSYSYTTTLAANAYYDIELHYFERVADAMCRLQWSYPGQSLQTIPQNQLYPPSSSSVPEASGAGLRGQYYNGSNNLASLSANPFAGSPVLTRTDATVNFTWGRSSPGSSVKADNFTVKWIGQVRTPVAGNYTFTITADDGLRLFLNGFKVIDGWKEQGSTNYSYTTTLAAGLQDIEVHYFESVGDATCRLQWSYPGQSLQIIPQSRLFTAPGQ